MLALLLVSFQNISGLKINLQKSELLVTAADRTEISAMANALGCKPAQFPVKYLGLPLSNKHLGNQAYDDLIAKVDTKLRGWKSRFLSYGGRLVLLNSVLTAMPVYFMAVFRLPVGVVKKIDRIRRDFLWKGINGDRKGYNLVNWQTVCRPKKMGGLGVRDLTTVNRALLMKLLFQWIHPSYRLWKDIAFSLGHDRHPWQAPRPLPLWRGIGSVADPLHCSIVTSTGEPLRWRWTINGMFTAKSAYNFLACTPSFNTINFPNLWRLKVPTRIHVFGWFMLHNRLLTTDNLIRRGWILPNICHMCLLNAESIPHLFGDCQYTVRTCHMVCTLMSTHHTALGALRNHLPLDPIELITNTNSVFASSLLLFTLFGIWKQRCRLIFNNESQHPFQLAIRVIRDWRQFIAARALWRPP